MFIKPLGSSILLASAILFSSKFDKKSYGQAPPIPPNITQKAIGDTSSNKGLGQHLDKDPGDNSGDLKKAYNIVSIYIESKDYHKAITFIQKQFFEKENIPVLINNKWHMSHDLAHDLIERIPKDKQRFYFGQDGIIDKDAARELNKVIEAGDSKGLEKVWQRYPHTHTGKIAAFLFVSH